MADVKTGGAADKQLGHVALHYKTPADAPRAAKLMALLGFKKQQEIDFGGGVMFYQFMVADDATHRGAGTFYLSLLPPPLANITRVIREELRVGSPQEHPAVAELRAGQAQDPEMNFHVGVLLESLEEMERLMAVLAEANANDPDLKGRLKLVGNKAKPGDAAIDARMAASPFFSQTPRQCYGKFGVQAFVETDLLAGGPLGENMVIELDYVFAGHQDEHMFIKTELAG